MDIIGQLGAVFAVLTFAVVPLHAQKSNGAYNYPIKPGTSEWKTLTSHDQMQRVCQIPDATLKSMSTTDLIETCLNYPLFGGRPVGIHRLTVVGDRHADETQE